MKVTFKVFNYKNLGHGHEVYIFDNQQGLGLKL